MDGSQVAQTAAGAAPHAPDGTHAVSPLAALQQQRRNVLKAAIVLSVLLHAGSLYALLHRPDAGEVGAIEALSDAITVELVQTATIETTVSKLKPEPAPAVESSAPTEGRTQASDAKTAKAEKVLEPEPREVMVPEPPLRLEELSKDLTPPAQKKAPAEAVVPSVEKGALTVAVPEPAQPERAVQERPREPPPRRKIQKRTAERAPKGGVTSKAQASRGAGGRRASASTGSILSYAAHVRARVAANKPSGGESRGTATVHFGLTTSGGLAFAAVSRTSGVATLDKLAVSAVRQSAPFPPPPAGATTAQLRFSISFYFQ
jgi:protein TonB